MTENAVLRYLRRDPLKHILHLKMLAHHSEIVQTTQVIANASEGILLLFPITALSYDYQKYGNYDLVAMPAADSPQAFNQLLDCIPKRKIVFKLIHDADKAKVRKRFDVSHERAFLNFTAVPTTQSNPDPEVTITTQLNEELIAALGKNGHTSTELARFFADGGKALAIKNGNRIKSVGMVYRNFDHIWEVAALYTEPAARGKGCAGKVVKTALHILQEQDHTPRFVVDAENFPSIKLAQSVGLKHFLTVTHYTTRESFHALNKKSHLA